MMKKGASALFICRETRNNGDATDGRIHAAVCRDIIKGKRPELFNPIQHCAGSISNLYHCG